MSQAFTDILERLALRRDLSRPEAASALEEIMDGRAGEAQAAAFLMGLRTKGETADEIAGLAAAMRRHAVPVFAADPASLVDVVGTGGDGLGTFNISTTAAFVVAGAGVKVAKHGNRAASSRCGSADVLEALGVRIDLRPEEVAACIDEIGIGFMLARLHHPAAAQVAGVRGALGIRTVFNFLGPLTNPAGARRQLLGVGAGEYLGLLAQALACLGCERALLVHGDEGLDELSISGSSTVVEVVGNQVWDSYQIEPEGLGIARREISALAGGGPQENAAVTREVLAGVAGPRRDVVLLNAAAALYVAGVAASLQQGVAQARESIDSGRAALRLRAMVSFTDELVRRRS